MHECIFRMGVGSAARQIDRAGTKYRLTSIYLIDDKPYIYRMIVVSACRQVGR